MAYLDPQETLWSGQSGRSFKLTSILSSDSLRAFNGIADFKADSTECYKKTLFRFPLRTKPSGLSGNQYTVENILQLIDALKAEAKFLLIFLRSVTCIEVYEISHDENQQLLFRISIADDFLEDLTHARNELATKVKHSHAKYNYDDTEIHGFVARFDVDIYDHNTGNTTTAHWIVANQVGSTIQTVRTASMKQNVFPWVGAALDLDNTSSGRIFCFLPMPPEMSSKLPIHVNGTFGVNDDRRSLKWPGVERRNDPTGDWNTLLVSEVLPSCYCSLLLEARKHITTSDQFYTYWPKVLSVQSTQWQGILRPLLNFLLQGEVVWCATTSHWLLPGDVFYTPKLELKKEIITILTNRKVKIAKIPDIVREAFRFCSFQVTEINPSFVRNIM